MALVVADRVKETTTTTGTGTITLAGAEPNFITFTSALSDGDTTYYAIVDDANSDFEVGLGTFTASGTTLARTTVLASSNSGSAVDLQSGTKEVFINYPADKSVYLDGSDQLVINGTAVTSTATEINYLDITTLGLTEASKAVTADANGVVNFDAGTTDDVNTITSSSNAATINLQLGNVFEHDLTENVTYTFSNPGASGTGTVFVLKVIQGSTARTITWPTSVDWAGGTAPTLSTGNNEVDVFVFFTIDGGTTYYGFTAGQDLS